MVQCCKLLCRPVMTAMECVMSMTRECGIFELNDPTIIETQRQLRVVEEVVNFICRDHVEGTYRSPSESYYAANGSDIKQCCDPSVGLSVCLSVCLSV